MNYNFDTLLQMKQVNLWKTSTSSQNALHVMFYKQRSIEQNKKIAATVKNETNLFFVQFLMRY